MHQNWANCAAIMDYIISKITVAGNRAASVGARENQNTWIVHVMCSVIIRIDIKPS